MGKRRKGKEEMRGKCERVREYGLIGDPSLFSDDVAKWRDVVGSFFVLGIHAPFLCVLNAKTFLLYSFMHRAPSS